MSASNLLDVELRAGVRLCNAPALFIEETQALVVADVHWGYAASQRHAGRLVPVWGDGEIDARLDGLVRYYRPRRMVVLGDIVHALPGASAAEGALARLASDVEIVLVSGNHDRYWASARVESHTEWKFFLHHGDRARRVPPGLVEVIGHHHPAAILNDGAGTHVKMPALVDGRRRFILPAFSPWAGGVAWNNRLEAGERLWLISPKRIFPLPCIASGGAPRRRSRESARARPPSTRTDFPL